MLIFASAAGSHGADNAEPQSEPARSRPGYFHFQPTELALEFEAQLENRTVRTSDNRGRDSRQRNRDTQFAEALSLRLDGDILDPNFIRWDGAFRLGLRQEHFDEKLTPGFDRTDSSDGILLDYDFSIDVLPSKPVSAHAYARQVRDRVPRRFLPSLLEERSEAGAAVYFNLGSWTSELGFDWSDIDRSGNRAAEDDEHLQSSRFYTDNRWTISESQSLRLAFDHSRQESDYQGSRHSFTTDRDELRLEHELQFGEGQRNRLGTFFRWSDERGDLARDETEFTPHLSLRHSEWLETAYRYSFYRLNQDAVDLNRHKVDWQAIIRPDQRFRFTSDLFALWEDVEDDIDTHQFGGGLHGTYRQPTETGQLSIYAAIRADQVRNIGSGGQRLVRSEGHALDASRPTFLNEPDIIRTSIVAYNGDRSRIFLPSTDYVVHQSGRRTLVYRTLTGRIAEEEAVFFDYQFSVPADARIDTYWTQARIEHAFDFGATPYYAFDLRRQDVNGSRGTPIEEDNTERHRFGMNFRRPTWSINGEIELLNDPFEPFNAYKLDAQATLLRLAEFSMDGAAHFSYYDFTGNSDRRHVPRVDLDLRNEFRINPRFNATVATSFRWEDDSSRGETTGVDVECGLHYQRGQLGIDLTFEYDLLSIVDSREDGFGVWLNVRRDLSHLLRAPTLHGGRRVQ